MKIIESEKWYLVTYDNPSGVRPIGKRLVMNEGTARFLAKKSQEELPKYYKNVKVVEIDLADPTKSRFLK